MVRIYIQKGKEVFPKKITWNKKSKVTKSNLGFLKVLKPDFTTTWHYVGACIYCGGNIETPTYKYKHPLTGEIKETPNCGWGECSSCGGV